VSRRVLGLIAVGLLVWGAYLALGDWLHYNATATWRPWRSAMILAAVGGFLGFWWLMLRSRARRLARDAQPPPEQP
jgi:hypothetical protein